MRQIVFLVCAYIVLNLLIPHLWEWIMSTAPPWTMKWIIFAAVVLVLACVVFTDPVYSRLTKPASNPISSTLLFVMLLAASGATAWWQFAVVPTKEERTSSGRLATSPSPSPDSLDLSKAWIAAKLEIESVGARFCNYRIRITNGPLFSYNIRVLVQTASGFKRVEREPIAGMMNPGGELWIPGAPMVLQIGRRDEVNVQLFFDVSISDKTKHFISAYSFPLSPDDLKPQVLLPSKSWFSEGLPPSDEQDTTELSTYLIKPNGMMRFEATEMAQGKPNVFGDKNDDRQFVFNPQLRRVVFRSKTASGTIKTVGLPLDKTFNGKHLVLLSWNPNGCLLSVDGAIKQDFDKTTQP
jgi:hypothetical protein